MRQDIGMSAGTPTTKPIRAGGRAVEAGMTFQAAVATWFAVHIGLRLAERAGVSSRLDRGRALAQRAFDLRVIAQSPDLGGCGRPSNWRRSLGIAFLPTTVSLWLLAFRAERLKAGDELLAQVLASGFRVLVHDMPQVLHVEGVGLVLGDRDDLATDTVSEAAFIEHVGAPVRQVGNDYT
jgi:hypothetical protein